jgi:hypothetical protein
MDNAFLHNFFYLAFIDMPAFHTAEGMPGVDDLCRLAVKCFLPHWFVPPADKKNQKHEYQKKKRY